MLDDPNPKQTPLKPFEDTEWVLTNGTLVTEDETFTGTVVISDGQIAEVREGVASGQGVVDLQGDLLIPGLIDIHTDNLEKHIEPRPGVAWPALAALICHDRQLASAGITTVFDSLYVAGAVNAKDVARAAALNTAIEALKVARNEGLLLSDHYLHLRCELGSETLPVLLAAHIENPMVQLLSVMDHTPGQRQWRDIAKWRQFNSRKYSAEDLDEMIRSRRDDQEKFAAKNRRDVMAQCQSRNLPVASHDDTTPQHINEATADGIVISEFPCTLEAAVAAKANGMMTVMGAPNVVKGGSHSGNVAAGTLAEAGLLDGLASDYVPISMIEGAFLLHDRHGMTLPEAIATVSINPARMVGMNDRGRIAPAHRADLVRVHMSQHMPIVRSVWNAGLRVL